MIRIITGKAKGKKIDVPLNITRPLTDRIKTSIFDSIQHLIPNSEVLDLYSGSGNFGIEALSRGAEQATFVDSSSKAITLIKNNLKKVGLADQANVIKSKANNFIKDTRDKFDIIFADPPFPIATNKKLETFKLIPLVCKQSSIFIVRIQTEESLPSKIGQFNLLHQDKLGVSVVGYYGE